MRYLLLTFAIIGLATPGMGQDVLRFNENATDDIVVDAIVKSLREANRELDRVQESFVDDFNKTIASATSIDEEDNFASEVKAFKSTGVIPKVPALIDLAAKQQLAMANIAIPLLDELAPLKEIASRMKYRKTYRLMSVIQGEAEASTGLEKELAHVPGRLRMWYTPSFYAILSQRPKITLSSAPDWKQLGEDRDANCELRVVKCDRGIIEYEISGKAAGWKDANRREAKIEKVWSGKLYGKFSYVVGNRDDSSQNELDSQGFYVSRSPGLIGMNRNDPYLAVWGSKLLVSWRPEEEITCHSQAPLNYRAAQLIASANNYRKAFGVYKDDLQTALRESKWLLKSEDYKGAIRALDDVIRIDPNNQVAIEDRIQAKLGVRDYESALMDVDECIRRKPDDSKWIAVKSIIYSSCPYESVRNVEKALELANRAITLGPEKPYSLNAMSCALGLKRDFAGALEWQKKAMDNAEWMRDYSMFGGGKAEARLARWEGEDLWFLPGLVSRIVIQQLARS